ncbi:MAG: thiamine pyrophosphate-dependent dehydrogenase E1 component subunit alpha [Spirochaetes bacterium]|nr:thiamine pyrophosphate-dependent dehydrogenase E1 component subunit alpha [Spirochaetota bacterium]
MDRALRLQFHDLMVKTRALELRMIAMVRSGDGYFWIGGPGEEAVNVALGLQVRKGEGIDYDYLLLHYRNTGMLMAMGIPLIDPIRLMRSTATDPFTRGRSFSGHYAYKPFNILPVTSPIGTQFGVAPGLALAQKRAGSKGVTIVIGGDAGAAEPDFASGLIWATRPGRELPILFLITDNSLGISTRKDQVWAMEHISDRAKPFGIPTRVIDGNDPEASHAALGEALETVRRTGRPYMIDAKVSRLYGHSSSSGTNLEPGEDPIARYEKKLVDEGIATPGELKAVHERYHAEALAALEQVRLEPFPAPHTLYDHTFVPSPVDLVYGERYFNPNRGD